jgi:hypothetical protein
VIVFGKFGGGRSKADRAVQVRATTGIGPDGAASLRSRRLTRATDLSYARPMYSAGSDVTFPPATTGGAARMGIFHSRCFRPNSGELHPALPDEGRERDREGSLRLPHPSPISNRELWTVGNSTTSIVQLALPAQGSLPPLRGWRSQRSISDTNSRPLAPFLPGSVQYVECDVTRSKQTTATFLPGSRIAQQRLAPRQVQP